MQTTNLRKVGGSVMLALSPAILDLLHLKAGSTVSIAVEGGRLVIQPTSRQHYTMAELLAASDYAVPQPPEEREWVDAPAIGRDRHEAGRYLSCGPLSDERSTRCRQPSSTRCSPRSRRFSSKGSKSFIPRRSFARRSS